MRELVLGNKPIGYLNQGAAVWLREAREVAAAAGLKKSSWHEVSQDRSLLFAWCGTRTQRTMILLSKIAGIDAIDREVAVEFAAPARVVRHKLLGILHQGVAIESMADKESVQTRRKYDEYLPKELLRKSFIADALNVDGCLTLVGNVCTEDYE